MIFGSFSYSDSIEREDLSDRISKMKGNDELVVHPVTGNGFRGGFLINNILPYYANDFYFCNEEIVVLLSGVIYNREGLLKFLNISRDIADPELISVIFLKEGPDFVKRLNGDFSIFIGALGKKEAYLFRDQVGIRPMAYTTDGHELYFSSDSIGLCAAFSEGQHIDNEYLLRYFKYTDGSKTPVEGIKKLAPGHYIRFSQKGIESIKYWFPEEISVDNKMSYDKMMADLNFIVRDAVSIRCDSRFTAGAHVSGGLDSGIVSALARREYPQQARFYGFSWSPASYDTSDIITDERENIASLCRKAGIEPVFSDLNAERLCKVVSDYYDNQGYFCEDRICELAAGKKTNLLLSGWGGDEFISTGDRGVEIDLLHGFHLVSFFRRTPLWKPRLFVKVMLHFVLFPMLGIPGRATTKYLGEKGRYIKKPYNRNDKELYGKFYFHTSRHQIHLRLLHFYHLQERCESWAINGYRKGVEYRYPLLDKRIIEYMLRVPSVLLCKSYNYRPLLREIGRDILPDEVRLNRSKNDPLFRKYIDDLYKTSASEFMNEVDVWRQNTELYFVNFDLLAKDIVKYREKPEKVESQSFFESVVYIKGINDFTKEFHRQCSDKK